jgi:hypothetical protein
MRKSPKFSPEVQDRAVRMVFDAEDQYPSQWGIGARIPGAGTMLRGDRCVERSSALDACRFP